MTTAADGKQAQALVRHDPSTFEPWIWSGEDQEPTSVEAGDFRIDPKARAPAEKLETLKGLHLKFSQTWDAKRADLPSPSEYDLALANMMWGAAWEEQEIVDALIEWRRIHGHGAKLRADYYARTLAKVKASPTAQAEREAVLEAGEGTSAVGVATRRHSHQLKLSALDQPQRLNTHRANAWRTAERHGHELRHCEGLGFLVFDGKHWRRSEVQASRLAARVSRYVCEEAAEFSRKASQADDETRRKGLEEMAEMLNKWARASEQGSAIRESLKLSRSLVPLEVYELDRHPLLLNVENGTIDLRERTLRPHAAGDLLTTIVPVWYNPAAEAPRWQTFVAEIMGRRESLIRYLQKALGYSLTGWVKEQCIFFCYGSGLNGKSTLLDTVREILGPSHVTKAAPDLLIASKHSRPHPAEIADLRGARLVISQEVANQKEFDTQKLKDLTGERWLKGRYMRQDWFEFPATFKIWLAANHRPRTSDNTPAFWRRIRLIPFTQRIEKPDKDLVDKLLAEKPGILNWLLDGLQLYLQNGLEAPPEVTAAIEEYRLESDSLAQFIMDCCLRGDGLEVKAMELRAAYEAYATERGLHVVKKGDFKAELLNRGFTQPPRRGTGYYYRGLMLKPETEEPAETDPEPRLDVN